MKEGFSVRISTRFSTRGKAIATATVAALAVPAISLAMTGTACAQVDLGSYTISENGAKVGEIYVPYRPPGSANYEEDWVLYPNYAYPGPANPDVSVTISPSPIRYANQADFFNRVPFGKGYKFVKVMSQESAVLPNGRTG